MTQYFQFKSATVPLVEYAGDDYTYQITNTGWTIIDVDAIDFAQLLDIINKVNTRELFVISRTKLFDALELKLGNELGSNLAPSINGIISEWNGVSYDTEEDLRIRSIKLIDSKVTDIVQYNSIDKEVTVDFSGVNNKAGFVCITNITPTNITDNVSSREYDDSGIALIGCRSSTVNVDIEVLAITGLQNLKPEVIVNGSYVTLNPHTTENLWKGTVSRTLVESIVPGEYIVEAYHSEGNTDTAIVYLETPPVVTVAAYTGNYPNALSGQTSYVNGRTVGFTVTADKDFTHLEILADSDCGLAYTAINPPELVAPFTEYTTRTGSALTVAVATNGVYTKHLKVRVKNANTTNAWGAPFTTTGTTDHVNLIKLDSRLPVATIGTIGYPGTQKALKGTESVTSMPVTYTNVEQIAITSPNGELTVGGTIGGASVTATRIDPGLAYNITDPNVSILAKRLSNDTQSTSTAVVFTANATPIITMSVPYARLRSSGGSGQNYTVTLTSNPVQRLLVAPIVTAPGGSLGPTWTGSVNDTVWTNTINVHDGDTKGIFNFGLTSAVNLAGVPTTVITTGFAYTLGGFVQRGGFFAPFASEASIGTTVSDTSRLVVVMNALASDYYPGVRVYVRPPNTNAEFTITSPANTWNASGNILHNNVQQMVDSNASGTMAYTIEETV